MSSILLPANAKYFGFVESDYPYNSNWDVTWSFTYALTGSEHGFCTFLTSSTSISGYPGQYLGYSGPDVGDHVLGIAFDSTGYFALSNTWTNGLHISTIRPNSLIVRDTSGVIYSEQLSALDNNFTLSTSAKDFTTMRFRIANGNKLYVDYKSDNLFKNLLTLNITPIDVDIYPSIYPAFSYSSPISSNSIAPSKLWLKNFHIQGNVEDPSYETLNYFPISSTLITAYTTVSGISASL